MTPLEESIARLRGEMTNPLHEYGPRTNPGCVVRLKDLNRVLAVAEADAKDAAELRALLSDTRDALADCILSRMPDDTEMTARQAMNAITAALQAAP